MKKFAKILSLTLIAAMSAMMVACSEKPEPGPMPEPEPTPEDTTPSVSITAGEAGEDYLTFSITSKNVKRAFFVAISEDLINEVTVTADFVLESPNLVPEPNTTCEIRFGGRIPNTKYYVYAAGLANSGEKVLSECVEMHTTAHQYTTTELPSADVCNINLTALSSTDRYAFSLTDNAGSLEFAFNLYTIAGLDGAIPSATYAIADIAAAGYVELGSISLTLNGLPIVISEGTLDVELYNSGSKIRLNGQFKLVSGDNATFAYDGNVTFFGIGSEVDDPSTVKFTRINSLTTYANGSYEVQFTPAEGFSMLDLMITSDPGKSYITNGYYPVCASADSAAAMGYAHSYISTNGSFYQDELMLPCEILPGKESYMQVTTTMENGIDYYDITFSIKIHSLVDQSESVLKAVYKGAIGFKPSGATPTMEMVSMYVDITSNGNQHKIQFHGGFTTMVANIEAESLPEVGGNYVWYDIVSGNFSDAYAGVYNHPITNGRIAIKRFPDAADASDYNKVKAYYGFKIEGKLEDVTLKDEETGETTIVTFDLVGEWTSFQTTYVSEW